MEWIISNIVIVAILIAVILVVTILMTGYVKAPPDMAFIISGLQSCLYPAFCLPTATDGLWSRSPFCTSFFISRFAFSETKTYRSSHSPRQRFSLCAGVLPEAMILPKPRSTGSGENGGTIQRLHFCSASGMHVCGKRWIPCG